MDASLTARDLTAFGKRAAALRIKQLFPEIESPKLIALANTCEAHLKKGSDEALYTERLEKLGMNDPETRRKLKVMEEDIGGAIVGLGIDAYEPGAESYVRWRDV